MKLKPWPSGSRLGSGFEIAVFVGVCCRWKLIENNVNNLDSKSAENLVPRSIREGQRSYAVFKVQLTPTNEELLYTLAKTRSTVEPCPVHHPLDPPVGMHYN